MSFKPFLTGLFLNLIALSAVAAEHHATTWNVVVNNIRSEYAEVEWPQIEDPEGDKIIAENEKKEWVDGESIKKILVDYCIEYSKNYDATVKKMVKIDDLGTLFTQNCITVKTHLSKYEGDPPGIDVKKTVQTIRYREDWFYYQYINSPWTTDIKKLDGDIKAYRKTPLAMIGVSYENRNAVLQYALVGVLVVVLFGVVLLIR